MTTLAARFESMPLVAILRGVEPTEAESIAEAIVASDIRIIEVPLNSPSPFDSIERLSRAFEGEAVIGAGTVTSSDDALRVRDAGGTICVSPNYNAEVIRTCIDANMTPFPGWATPSEAFAAYADGARYLKLFPAATYGPGHVRAVRAVLPKDATVLAVGGVGANDFSAWQKAGVHGFGIGSELYRPGAAPADVAEKAATLADAWRSASC